MRALARLCILVAAAAVMTACANRAPSNLARIDHRDLTRAPQQSYGGSCAAGARYTVQSGDTASEIAEACNISLRDLAQANGLRSPYTLRAGQELTMPRPPTHRVQRGENLYRIGLRYGLDCRDQWSAFALSAGSRARAPLAQWRARSACRIE